MYVNGFFGGRATRPEQRVDETGKSVGFADDHVGVFAQLGVLQLAFEQLRCAANTAERVLDFVRELPNHLSPGTMLNDQRIFATDLIAPGDIGDFDQQNRVVQLDGGDSAVDDAIVRVHLGRCKVHFVRIVIAGDNDAAEYFA